MNNLEMPERARHDEVVFEVGFPINAFANYG